MRDVIKEIVSLWTKDMLRSMSIKALATKQARDDYQCFRMITLGGSSSKNR